MSFRVALGFSDESYHEYCRQLGLDIMAVNLKNDEDSVIEKLKGYDCVIAMAERLSARVLDALSDRLKLIIRHGIGYDLVDIQHAAQLGICCCNTPGTMSEGVAETALTMMLELSRKFYIHNASMNRGNWEKGPITQQFEGKTIGLIGFGHIAQCLARYLIGFTKCRVLAYDVCYNEEALKAYHVQKASIDEIAREADFVSVHVPLLPATAKMINAEFLAKMKPTAYLINTSRGGTVDEAALTEALKSGVIAGAGLDVYESEPMKPENELYQLVNVFKTPHVATYTQQCIEAGFDGVIKCIREYEAGQMPEFTLNPDYVNHMKRTRRT